MSQKAPYRCLKCNLPYCECIEQSVLTPRGTKKFSLHLPKQKVNHFANSALSARGTKPQPLPEDTQVQEVDSERSVELEAKASRRHLVTIVSPKAHPKHTK